MSGILADQMTWAFLDLSRLVADKNMIAVKCYPSTVITGLDNLTFADSISGIHLAHDLLRPCVSGIAAPSHPSLPSLPLLIPSGTRLVRLMAVEERLHAPNRVRRQFFAVHQVPCPGDSHWRHTTLGLRFFRPDGQSPLGRLACALGRLEVDVIVLAFDERLGDSRLLLLRLSSGRLFLGWTRRPFGWWASGAGRPLRRSAGRTALLGAKLLIVVLDLGGFLLPIKSDLLSNPLTGFHAHLDIGFVRVGFFATIACLHRGRRDGDLDFLESVRRETARLDGVLDGGDDDALERTPHERLKALAIPKEWRLGCQR